MTVKLGVLGSTRGTVLQAIIDAIESQQLDAHIEIVISNCQEAYILERAKTHNIPALFVDPAGLSRRDYDEKISQVLKNHQVDLIALIGYMKILSKPFVKTWDKKILNVHPSLLPKHAGLMDRAVHQAVLDAKDQVAGCTVHYVNDIVDGGEIVLQKTCDVATQDTVDSLKEKVQALEKKAFVEAIQQWKKP
jgi:formyltetrahydrofolate-dependent phosphoribosylglycinamide formyltransferase